MTVKFVTLCAALVLAGCATTGKYRTLLDTSIGHNISGVTAGWGPPAQTVPTAQGTWYVYRKSYSFGMPSYTNSQYSQVGNMVYGNSTTTGGGTVTAWCETSFLVDSNSIITNYTINGNDCTM